MQLFIGRIPKSYTYDEIYEYFSKIGKIKSLRVLEGYGFICFEEKQDAIKALEMQHSIDGNIIVVEESQNRMNDNRKREDYRRDDYRRDDFDDRRRDFDDRRRDFDDRRRDYDFDDRRRDYDRGFDSRRYDYDRGFDSRRYDYDRGFDSRRRDYDDRRSAYDRDYERGDRSPRITTRKCDYCDRCPIHGVDKGYAPLKRYNYDDVPQNVPKIVLMGINPDTQVEDVKEFIHQYKLESSFIRITNNKKYAIIEFRTLEEKEKALINLENKELLGNIVQARSYKVNSRQNEDDRKRYRKSDDDDKKNNENEKTETQENANENVYNDALENEQKHAKNDELYGDLPENK